MDTDIMQAGLRDMFKDPKLMEMFSKLKDSDDSGELQKAMYDHIIKYHHNVPQTLYELDNRIERLEQKAFGKNISSKTVRSQQMLILSYLGFFELPKFKKISSNKKKAKILSTLLNASSDNIEGDLSLINLKSSPLKSLKNLDFIQKVFDQAGLKEICQEVEVDSIKMASKKTK